MIAKIVREDEMLTIPDVDNILLREDDKLTLISGNRVVGIFLEGQWSCVWLEDNHRSDNDVTAVIPRIRDWQPRADLHS
jgi:hypothetical protein